MQTVKYSRFVNGIDRSQGRFTEDPRLLQEADNVVFTNGQRIRMAPPIKRLDVELDSQTQGFAVVDCRLVTIAKSGDSITHTGTDAGEITTLYFDPPDYCDGDWELLHLTTFQNKVEAWIKHDFSGADDEDAIVFKHTLDPRDEPRTKPTYCIDPWCPTNWDANGTRPLHLYGKGEIGQFSSSFDPVSNTAAEKLCAARPNGDIAFSGVGKSHIWNPFSLQDLLDFGMPYYFRIPDLSGVDLFGFTVPEYYSDLDNDRAWAGYVLEYLDSDGRWQKVTEVDSSPTNDKTYEAQPVQSRFESERNEIRIALRWQDDPGVWIRWRAVAGLSPIQIIDGGALQEGYTPDSWSEAGDDETTQFTTDVDYDDFRVHYFTNLLLDGLEIPLILGQGMHYTISDDDGKGRIDFCTDSGVIEQLASGTVENSYITNLKWDTQRYVEAFAPTVWKDGDPTDVVSTADYTLSNEDGFIRLTWDDNLPAIGTEWTIGFLPTSSDTVQSDATEVHYEAGSYLFEGVVWEFPAIRLSDVPVDSDLLAGIPHYPLLFGSSVDPSGGGNAVYTTPGAHSYVVPAGVHTITVSLWGAGGGGGGGDSEVIGLYRGEAGGGGGGGGEYHSLELAVTPGETLTFTVGAGGSGGRSHCSTVTGGSCNASLSNGEDGSNGGASIAARGAATLASVQGGRGGSGGVHNGSGATGGSGGAGGDTGFQPGVAGGAGSARRHITGYGPWQNGGSGGASGAGDTNGRGGDGARAQVFSDGCVCSRYDSGDDGNDGRILVEAKVGLNPWVVDPDVESMPLNGWQRYHIALQHRFTTDGSGDIVGSKEYHYGAEEGAESQFYADRRAEYADLAGEGDAGYLGTSVKQQTCGAVVALSGLQDKLAVHFASETLLYAFGLDPEANAPLDQLHFGSKGPTADFFGGAMVLTQQSFRVMNLRGENFDSLRDNNYGRPIEDLDITAIHNALYWPAIGCYVAFVTLDGEVRPIIFSFSWEEKVRAWTTRSVRGLTSAPVVDSLWDDGERLYFRDSNLLRYFSNVALGSGEFYDDTDEIAFEAAGGEDAGLRLEDYKYAATVRFQQNNLGDPRTIKKWNAIDVECDGECKSWLYETDRADAKRSYGPTFNGTSLTTPRKSLILRSYSLGVELESKDLDGWELDSMYLQVRAARR